MIPPVFTTKNIALGKTVAVRRSAQLIVGSPADDLRRQFARRHFVDHAAQRTGSEYIRLGREDAGGTNDGGAGCDGHARCRGGVDIGHQQLRPCLVQHLRECGAKVTDALNGDRAVGQWPMQPSVGGKLHRKKAPPRGPWRWIVADSISFQR